MELVNGMPAEDARALYDIAESACALVEGHSDETLFDTMKALEISVGTNWTDIGTSMDYKLPRDLFHG